MPARRPTPTLRLRRLAAELRRLRADAGLRPLGGASASGVPDPYPRPAELRPNQAFMLEIGPGGRAYNPSQHLYGGYCVVTTDGAPRRLGTIPIEEMLLKAIV